MSELNDFQKRLINSKISNYHTMKMEVAQWENDIIHGKGRKSEKELSQKSKLTVDPTGNKGIKLAEPPNHIQEKKTWIKTIDAAMQILENSDKRKVIEVGYWSETPKKVNDLANELNISVTHYYNWRDDIIGLVVRLASENGIFKQ